MICPKCGSENKESNKFCEECGCDLRQYRQNFCNDQSKGFYQDRMNNRNAVNNGNRTDGPSTMGIVALVLAIIPCTFVFGIVLAGIDLALRDGKNKLMSKIALGIGGAWFFMGAVSSCASRIVDVFASRNDNQSYYSSFTDDACVISDEKSYCGMQYDSVLDELELAGFTNISEVKIEDLSKESSMSDGTVESVLIDGKGEFHAGDKFAKDSSVVVTYHIIPRADIPISSGEIQDVKYTDLAVMFEDAGFHNVTIKEEYDLDPDETDKRYVNEVTVDNDSSFEVNEEVPFDSDVVITCHFPYEKYTVKVKVEFVKNLIFSRYDVDLLIDDEKLETLKHGTDAEYEYRFVEGEYVIRFAEADIPDNYGEATVKVDSDIEITYKISTHYDRVDVEEKFIKHLNPLRGDEIKITGTEYSFRNRVFTDVAGELDSMGFTNIYMNPVYDLETDADNAGLVSGLTIDGSTDYIRGDIFNEDAEIVITYHMLAEDEPTPTPEPTATPTPSAEEPTAMPTPTPTSAPTSTPTPTATTTPKPTATATSTPTSAPKSGAVYYSTNDEDSVKKGNKGVYAYRDKGGTYRNYYVIDFDKGYVYHFTDESGNEYCDRIKMTSGDLNSVLIITYHDGGTSWTEGLHFKYKDHPDHLILQDYWGAEWDYYPTDLDDALKLKNGMTVYDY